MQRMNNNEYYRVALELKSLDETGEFTGYAAFFGNVDLLRDVVSPGAFTATAADWKARGTLPRVFWRHYQVIGHLVEMYEDKNGLFVRGRLWMDRPDVLEVYADIKTAMAGEVVYDDEGYGESPGNVGMSFGFTARDYEVIDGVRHIKRLDLADDITITLNPVNPSAGLVEIKSGDVVERVPDVRTLEAVLRDAGCSRRAAKMVLAAGYSSLREAKGDAKGTEAMQTLLDALTRATE